MGTQYSIRGGTTNPGEDYGNTKNIFNFMMTIEFSEREYEILKGIYIDDIVDLAQSPEFFDDEHINSKKYIDERMALGKKLDVDFWDELNLSHCHHSCVAYLQALYDGKTKREFIENYQFPTEDEKAVRLFESLFGRQ